MDASGNETFSSNFHFRNIEETCLFHAVLIFLFIHVKLFGKKSWTFVV